MALDGRNEGGFLEHGLTRNWRGLAAAITSVLMLGSVVAAHRITGEDPDTVLAGQSGVGPGAVTGQVAGSDGVAGTADDVLGSDVVVKGQTVTNNGTGGSGKGGSGKGGSGSQGGASGSSASASSGGGGSRGDGEGGQGGGGSGSGGGGGNQPSTPPNPPSGKQYTGKPGDTMPPGVTDDKIEVIYYWTDRTRDSPYRPDQGQANLDEGQAFMAFIEWINKHDGDGSKVMGYDFNLHGRKLDPKVIELSKAPEDRARVATQIAEQDRPFATLASHGSISTYMCDKIAEGGIHNLSTYDFRGNLHGRTNGYCYPLGMSWELQVEHTVAYLSKHKDTRYEVGAGVTEARKYGIVYAAYPGLENSIEGDGGVEDQLEAAGLGDVEVAALNPDLGVSQAQVPNVVAQFRGAGVNTVIFPDAGAPLNFTNGAQANGYNPDYYVWPCSGTDTIGMVRLFNPVQWSKASGITCYDDHFNPDLVNDDNARSTEWFKVWTEMRGTSAEAPSSGALIWFNLLPLLAGITESGPYLTVEGFRAGIAQVPNYRYDAITGRTENPITLLQTIARADHSPIGDVAKVRWSATQTRPGSTTQGSYVYPENRRYRTGDPF